MGVKTPSPIHEGAFTTHMRPDVQLLIVPRILYAGKQKPGTEEEVDKVSGHSGSLPDGAVIGIAVGCFVAGVLVGICLTFVAVQRSRFPRFGKHKDSASTEEQVTVSSAYELTERSHSEAAYADVVDTKRQETPSRFTSSPAYLAAADR